MFSVGCRSTFSFCASVNFQLELHETPVDITLQIIGFMALPGSFFPLHLLYELYESRCWLTLLNKLEVASVPDPPNICHTVTCQQRLSTFSSPGSEIPAAYVGKDPAGFTACPAADG